MKRIFGWSLVVAMPVFGIALVLLVLWQRQNAGPAPLDKALAQLRSDDTAQADAATKELLSLGEPGIDALLQARGQADLRTHRRAVLGLIQLRNSTSAKRVAEKLVASLPRSERRVAVALCQLESDAIPVLEAALSAQDRAVSAVRLLGEFGPQASAAASSVVAVLGDVKQPIELRREAASSLGRLARDDEIVVDGLVRALAESDQELRRRAIWALGMLESRSARMAIVPLLKDATHTTEICVALSRFNDPTSLLALIEKMKTQEGTDDANRAIIALGIARFGEASKGASPMLISLLAEQPKVAQLARGVLERTALWAKPALLASLTDPNAKIRAGSADVLGLLGPAAGEAVAAIVPMLTEKDDGVYLAAVRALSRIDPDAVKGQFGRLVNLLDNKDLAVQATNVLLDLGPEFAKSPEFAKLHKSTDERKLALVKHIATVIESATKDRDAPELPKLKPPTTQAPDILAKLDADETNVRVEALRQLGTLEDRSRFRSALRECLVDPAPEVRLAALRLCDDAESVRQTLRDPSSLVRFAAAVQLAKTGEASAVITREMEDRLRTCEPGQVRFVLAAWPSPKNLARLEADTRGEKTVDRIESLQLLAQLDPTQTPQISLRLLGMVVGWDEETRWQAANALSELPISNAIRERLKRQLLIEVNPEIRQVLRSILAKGK
jgi:HEAT repeat protein